MAGERQSVEVWADWSWLAEPQLVGRLHAQTARGKQIFSFEYARSWLATPHARSQLDPALRLGHGAQIVANGRENSGAFLDSSPDRWGRVLMTRREAQRARKQRRKERTLLELDFLLGVFDGHRLGGLRFRFEGGPFLDDDATLASPPWTSLSELEQASLRLERAGVERDPSYDKWLGMLIAPGRSLGGARPKAGVRDAKGRLWIAKFPSETDDRDVGAWETVVHGLATRAGIRTSEALCRRFASKRHTFLTRRFDRDDAGQRVHFASAMTLLERSDGEPGASYLEIAEVIARVGAHPERDLEELWRRIVLSVCVSNVDDHLRNHGFLLEAAGGWSLAPAYDVNPVTSAQGLSLNISETDNAQDLELVREVAKHFRVKPAKADQIIEKVVGVVKGWRKAASAVGISAAEQSRMATAFRVVA